jgi:hypothetical protein
MFAGMFCLAFLAGCGGQQQTISIDHGSPKALALSMHQAVESQDFAAVVACMAPDVRPAFKTALMAAADYVAQTRRTAQLAGQKIGPQAAAFFNAQADKVCHDVMVSPLEKAQAEGTVDWARVNLSQAGERADLTVDGLPTEFSKRLYFRNVGGQWYVASKEDPQMLQFKAQGAKQTFERMARSARVAQADIRDGRLNRENFKDASSGKAASAPTGP